MNEFGIVACCQVNRLMPYVIQKMKSVFKTNYDIYIKSNEEFYEKNINYEKNILFKKGNKNEETSETNKLNSIKFKLYQKQKEI